MKKIILVAFLIFALILSGCIDFPDKPIPGICGNNFLEGAEECEGLLFPCDEREGFEVSCDECKCVYEEETEEPPVEPPIELPLWGFGSLNPVQDSSYWWCSDNKHLTNGITTIECIGKCGTVDGRDRCIDPKIPPFGPQRAYECVGENWIAITYYGQTEYYYCEAGCEVMADGTTMCWCGTDTDCTNPDEYPATNPQGNTVNIIGTEQDEEEEEEEPPAEEVCGDAECNADETCETCAEDCGECPPPDPFCGDGTCDGNEDYTSCPDDCDIMMGGMGTG